MLSIKKLSILLATILMLFPLVGIAGHERAALIIGNQDYAIAPLDTPEADASAMADRLQHVGYQVTRLTNLRQSDFYDGVDKFFNQHKTAKVILFFYAGHAVQINGKNFLIPIDIQKESPDVLSMMFDVRYLIAKITASTAETKLIMLDACRDNLFSSNPNAGSGLSELLAPPGTFVAFSTAPGATAEDGDGDNSPYTTALIEGLFRPKIKIEDAFKEVRRKVMRLTENMQTPWESTSLIQDFYVVPDGIKFTPFNPASSKNKLSKNKNSVRSLSVNKSTGIAQDSKMCSRLLTKMSMGMSPLSNEELALLGKCH